MALVPHVSEGGQLGMVFQLGQVRRGRGQRLMAVHEDLRFERLQPLHVIAVQVRAPALRGVFRVLDVVVAPAVFVARQPAERPGRALDFAGLGHHQAVPLDAHVVFVALAARLFVDPGTGWRG